MTRTIQAPRGTQLTCKNWQIEAAYRMLQNNLDPQVAFDPDNLIVYGGRGRAARNWAAFDAILDALRHLQPDETLLVQSGKPVAIFTTHTEAPRVLLANSNIVPKWATQENFDKWERDGLIMYGQMTAGSWIYIGTQGILQGTYETFGALARQQGWGSLQGKLVVTAGLGEMGGAQGLAITMNQGVGLIVEADRWRVERRLRLQQVDVATEDLQQALAWVDEALGQQTPKAIALIGNAAEVLPSLQQSGLVPDVVTDQTAAHDVLHGYIPAGLTVAEASALRARDPEHYTQLALASIAKHVETLLAWQARSSIVLDYGNNLRQRAFDAGVHNAFAYPGFVPAYIRPLFCAGKGPFRWVALSGDPADIARTDARMKDLFSQDKALLRWLDLAGKKIRFQGLPARICWLGLGERHRAGLAFNEMVRNGELKAPIVIGRDHLDAGSVASPNRETEAMKDGSDAVSDWAFLNALLNCASGATWVSIHHGGGVGMGYSQHAGMAIVCDGSDAAARRIERVLWNDPASGVMRHADAGYEEAVQCARRNRLDLPMLE